MPVHVYRLKQKALRTFDITFALDSGRLLEEGRVFSFFTVFVQPWSHRTTTSQHDTN